MPLLYLVSRFSSTTCPGSGYIVNKFRAIDLSGGLTSLLSIIMLEYRGHILMLLETFFPL